MLTAENDEAAYAQAWELCVGEVVLLELHELDENYNFVRFVEEGGEQGFGECEECGEKFSSPPQNYGMGMLCTTCAYQELMQA